MRRLTNRETKLLARYMKVSALDDRFVLFKTSRESSNAMLDIAEARYAAMDVTDYTLTYLQGICRRKSKNYRKLQGTDEMLRFTRALKETTLTELALEG